MLFNEIVEDFAVVDHPPGIIRRRLVERSFLRDLIATLRVILHDRLCLWTDLIHDRFPELLILLRRSLLNPVCQFMPQKEHNGVIVVLFDQNLIAGQFRICRAARDLIRKPYPNTELFCNRINSLRRLSGHFTVTHRSFHIITVIQTRLERSFLRSLSAGLFGLDGCDFLRCLRLHIVLSGHFRRVFLPRR